MKNILRILAKDARHLWPQALIFVALLLACTPFPRSEYFFAGITDARILDFLAGVACCILVTAAIHEERLVGHRQYWLTRPIPRKDLIAAKAIFVLLSVNLPVLICQACVLAFRGFSPFEYISLLLAKQFFLTAFLILPAAAVAAITRDLARTVLGALAVLLAFALLLIGISLIWEAPDPQWGGLSWISTTAFALVLLPGMTVTVLTQYRSRRVLPAIAILAGTLAVAAFIEAMPPVSAAFRLQQKFSTQSFDPSVARIVFDPNARPSSAPKDVVITYPAGSGRPRIPIRIEGTADDLAIAGNWIRVQIDAPGVSWDSGWAADRGALWQDSRGNWLLPGVYDSLLKRIQEVPVHLHGVCDLTLLRRSRATSDPHCRLESGGVQCLSASTQVALAGNAFISNGSEAAANSPYPIGPSFSPLKELAAYGDGPNLQQELRGRVFLERPIAYVQREFDFPAIRLEDFMAQTKH